MKTYYYSVLTDKVSKGKTSSMRKYPQSYRVVQFSNLSKANLEERKSYADAYMKDICYQQIKDALNKDRDVYSFCYTTDRYSDGCLDAYAISNERGKDTCTCDVDLIPIPYLSQEGEAYSMFQELAARDKDNLVANFATYIDGYYYGHYNLAIKTSAIDRSDIHFYNRYDGCYADINIYMGTRRFLFSYTKKEFYENILSDKEILEKFKFDPGAVAKLVKVDLANAQKAADTNMKRYNTSLEKLNKFKGYYESLSPEERLLAELGD